MAWSAYLCVVLWNRRPFTSFKNHFLSEALWLKNLLCLEYLDLSVSFITFWLLPACTQKPRHGGLVKAVSGVPPLAFLTQLFGAGGLRTCMSNKCRSVLKLLMHRSQLDSRPSLSQLRLVETGLLTWWMKMMPFYGTTWNMVYASGTGSAIRKMLTSNP